MTTPIIRDGWDASADATLGSPLAVIEEIARDAGVRFIWSNGKWMVLPESAVTQLLWLLRDPQVKGAVLNIVTEHFARGGRP